MAPWAKTKESCPGSRRVNNVNHDNDNSGERKLITIILTTMIIIDRNVKFPKVSSITITTFVLCYYVRSLLPGL